LGCILIGEEDGGEVVGLMKFSGMAKKEENIRI